MIRIAGVMQNYNTLIRDYIPGSVKATTIHIKASSNTIYDFSSLDEMHFELNLRNSIVKEARKLNNSRFAFEVFKSSRCNTDYWERTSKGGFLLKRGVEPYNAIRDILINSSKYATECATAIVIVFYLGLTDVMPRELFNSLFGGLYLKEWSHLDTDLGIHSERIVRDILPGDCRYFRNPEVNPETPEWQGENVIVMGFGAFYGHGIGITTADGIIRALNRNRRSGSTKSAFLLPQATRPDYKYLYKRYASYNRRVN